MASSSEWPSASNRLRILAGGMEAGLAGPPDVEWSPGGDPVDDLRRWLATRGVKAGIDDKALGELAASLQAGIPIRWPVYVARGIPPRGATPGGIFVDLAPGILVRRGQEIGKVIAAGPPQPGKRVTGEEIAPPTKPQAPHRAGEGIQVDAAVCRSAVDGYLVKREDRFEVLSLLKEAVDRMSVEVILRPVREGSLRPSRALLEEIASERKYVGSIDWLAVEKALAVPVPAGTESRSVPLLVGDPGAAGKPGRTDLVIGAALAIGEEDDGGQVDYRQRSAVKSVRQGDLLARRVLPTPGTPATDIFGKAHPLPAPADAMLEPGRNVAVRGGGLEMYATAAGCVIVSDGVLSVDDVFEREGDVDLTVGNIEFPRGAVRIKGTVRDGFRVSAGTDIWVGGTVEDGSLSAGGAVTVVRGVVQKGHGRIVATGRIAISHGERAWLETEGPVTIHKSAVNCHVLAGGLVEVVEGRGVVRGGMVLSGERIRVKEVGTEAGVSTLLCLYPITHEVRGLEEVLDGHERKLAQVEHVVGSDREAARARLSTLPPDRRAYVEKLLLACDLLAQQMEQTQAELMASVARWEALGRGTHRIDVLVAAHPGTVIDICGAHLEVTTTLKVVSFWLDEGTRTVHHGPLIERVFASKPEPPEAAQPGAKGRPSVRILKDLRARLEASRTSHLQGDADLPAKPPHRPGTRPGPPGE